MMYVTLSVIRGRMSHREGVTDAGVQAEPRRGADRAYTMVNVDCHLGRVWNPLRVNTGHVCEGVSRLIN